MFGAERLQHGVDDCRPRFEVVYMNAPAVENGERMAGRRDQHVRVVDAADKTDDDFGLDNALLGLVKQYVSFGAEKIFGYHVAYRFAHYAAETANRKTVQCVTFIFVVLRKNFITEDLFGVDDVIDGKLAGFVVKTLLGFDFFFRRLIFPFPGAFRLAERLHAFDGLGKAGGRIEQHQPGD